MKSVKYNGVTYTVKEIAELSENTFDALKNVFQQTWKDIEHILCKYNYY